MSDTEETHPSLTCVTILNLVTLGQLAGAQLPRSSRSLTFPSSPSRLLQVAGTDTDQWATYDFLLVFHSKCGWVCLVLSEIKDIFADFPTPVQLMPLVRGFPWDSCNGNSRAQKLEWHPSQTVKKFWQYVHLFRLSIGIGCTVGMWRSSHSNVVEVRMFFANPKSVE